jgi:serine/threonine protein kinase
MDAPPEKNPAGPSDETHLRPKKIGETHFCNAFESNMEPPWRLGDVYSDYRIRGLLGRGRAGFVYSADDLLTKRRCALKVLCRMSSHDLYRNKLGFRRMSGFRHPCLMQTERIETLDGHTVLLMEEIDGVTLNEALRQHRGESRSTMYAKLVTLLHDFASGLAEMHVAGLVHRDLKPTNLMVRRNGRGVIVDYGLVTTCDPETDPYGIRTYIAGTPKYFSPEALWEQSYTPAGDVFSLGLVMLDCLNELAGGNSWMRAGNFDDWVRDEDEKVIAEAVSEIDSNVPRVLREAVAAMLSTDREERPSTMSLIARTKTDNSPIRLKTANHLYGREVELEQCRDWLHEIYRGNVGRLHICGEPGTGKTRLLDELERYLRELKWGQCFRVQCHSRESQTLQVMDQIADQIAQRYRQRDRDRLQLDPVSESILKRAFPQLSHVLEQDLSEAVFPNKDHSERRDALGATIRLSRELRKVGPLIIIIDDAQWSDPGSNNVWAALQQDTEGFLGIITASPEPHPQQLESAQKRIELAPLREDEAVACLNAAAARCGIEVDRSVLIDLVRRDGCNPFRLQELAEEFRPGGILHVPAGERLSDAAGFDLEQTRRARLEKLDDESKSILACLLAAGVPASIEQLEQLTGLQDRVDVLVSELVNQRLVRDEATGNECISIVHNKVGERLAECLGEAEINRAHLAWAALLDSQNRPRDFAARIAGHYYAAGRDGSALRFAITAAENAEKAFAKSDAAFWHQRVLAQVTGDARLRHLRHAARCFREADLPAQASHHYLMLCDETENTGERIQYRTFAAQLLVRRGKMDQARPLLAELAKQLEITRSAVSNEVNARTRRQLNRLAVHLESASHSSRSPSQRLEAGENDSPTSSVDGARQLIFSDGRVSPGEHGMISYDTMERCRLDFCREIGRPMTLLDLRGTVQLVLAGAEHAGKTGDLRDQWFFQVMTRFCASMLSDRGGNCLKGNLDSLQRLADSQSKPANAATGTQLAETWSAIAYSHAFEMNWAKVRSAVSICLKSYRSSHRPARFEIGYTRWLTLWADWHLGRWSSLRATAQGMRDDAERRNDSYQQLLSTAGFAGNAWLLDNKAEYLEQLCEQNNGIETASAEMEWFEFLRRIQSVQRPLYAGDDDRAAEQVLQLRKSMRGSLLRYVPLIRVTTDHLTALVSLHLRQREKAFANSIAFGVAANELRDRRLASAAIRRLLDRPYPFSKLLGNLARGIDARLQGQTDLASRAFSAAADLASTLGTIPYQLAAEDALVQLTQGNAAADKTGGSLRQHLHTHRVASPERIERLLTVSASPERNEGQ